MSGYLEAWHELDPAAVEGVLNNVVEQPALSRWLPGFETVVGLSAASVGRLRHAAQSGVPAWRFQVLASGRATDALSTLDLCDLLQYLGTLVGGQETAAHILAMRLVSTGGDRGNFDRLAEVARSILAALRLTAETSARLFHDLERLAPLCLAGEEGVEASKLMCGNLAQAISSAAVSLTSAGGLVAKMLQLQPSVALSAFLQRPRRDSYGRYQTILGMFEMASEHHPHPISKAEDEAVLKRCNESPAENFVTAATTVQFRKSAPNGVGLEWTGIALLLLQLLPTRRRSSRRSSRGFYREPGPDRARPLSRQTASF